MTEGDTPHGNSLKANLNRMYTRIRSYLPEDFPAARVSQLDASLLDVELFDTLRQTMDKSLSLFRGPGLSLTDRFEPELCLALSLVLFKFSIWDKNASYGAMLQNLEYRNVKNGGGPMTKRQKGLYGLGTFGVAYLLSRLDTVILSQEGRDGSRIGEKIRNYLGNIQTVHAALSLVNFLVFLTRGTYRTILDRLLGVNLAVKNRTASREVSFEFQNRQLVWHAFTEFLLFIVPLLHLPRLLRKIARYLESTKGGVGNKGELRDLPIEKCAICFHGQGSSINESTDIVNPYRGDCECRALYCYTCLVSELIAGEGEGWTCLRCGHVIQKAERATEKARSEGDDEKINTEIEG